MIYYFTPYDLGGHLFEGYDQCMKLLKNPSDWACFRDADVLIFQSNFGHIIEDYIRRYPDTGVFTCFANRIGHQGQLLNAKLAVVDSVKYHYKIAMETQKKNEGIATELKTPISGMLMVIQKQTWQQIRLQVMETCKGKHLLAVDNKISSAILKSGKKILRMDGLYLLHYYRMVEGKQKRQLQ